MEKAQAGRKVPLTSPPTNRINRSEHRHYARLNHPSSTYPTILPPHRPPPSRRQHHLARANLSTAILASPTQSTSAFNPTNYDPNDCSTLKLYLSVP
jgi:hypothetical protein